MRGLLTGGVALPVGGLDMMVEGLITGGVRLLEGEELAGRPLAERLALLEERFVAGRRVLLAEMLLAGTLLTRLLLVVGLTGRLVVVGLITGRLLVVGLMTGRLLVVGFTTIGVVGFTTGGGLVGGFPVVDFPISERFWRLNVKIQFLE